MLNSKKIISLLLHSQSNIGTMFCDHRLKRYVSENIKDLFNSINMFKTIKKMIYSLSLVFSTNTLQKVVVIDQSGESRYAIKKLCSVTGIKGLYQNYRAGNFTNTMTKEYINPTVAITVETSNNKKCVKELSLLKIPIISFCNTDCNISYIDLVIPFNTRSKFSKLVGIYIYTKLIKRIISPKLMNYKLKFKDFLTKRIKKYSKKNNC